MTPTRILGSLKAISKPVHSAVLLTLIFISLLASPQSSKAAIATSSTSESQTLRSNKLIDETLSNSGGSIRIAAADTTYTLAQVASNNTRTSCWTIISDLVYNITPYINSHPGGTNAISKLCGVDGTTIFNNVHGGSPTQANILAAYKIGALYKPTITRCDPGFFFSVALGNCNPAPIGYFVTAAAAAAGATSATACPIGYTTSFAGSTAASSCFMPIGAPTITALSATSGKRGQAIDIAGTNLGDALSSSVTLYTPATPTVAAISTPVTVLAVNTAGTTMTVLSPAVNQKGTLRVTNSLGTASASALFTASSTATSKPAITMTSSVVKEVGSTLSLSGTNLGSVIAITIGTVNAAFSIVNSTTIVITVPAGVVSGSKISATNPGGTTTTTKFVFQAPVIATTTAAAKAGQTVTVTGTNLVATAVGFSGMKSAKPVINTGSTLTFVVPTGALTGPIKITTGAGVVYTTSFTVTPPTPTVTSFTPTTGKNGLTVVTVKGTNLNGATVTIGSTPVTLSAGATSTSLKFTIPAGATSGRITVTTGGGSATATSTLTIN